MIPPEIVAVVGIAAGLCAVVLGIAQLTCEHPDAPLVVRLCVVLLALLGAWTGIDCWDAWSGVVRRVDYKSVAFCLVLAVYWGYRRGRGVRTEYRNHPPSPRA